jgi:hypothetical protein
VEVAKGRYFDTTDILDIVNAIPAARICSIVAVKHVCRAVGRVVGETCSQV